MVGENCITSPRFDISKVNKRIEKGLQVDYLCSVILYLNKTAIV